MKGGRMIKPDDKWKWGRCSICWEPFTEEEWGERHTDSAGGDCHEGCCDVCKVEDVDGMDLEDAFDLLMGE
jgi:hypothetical protein